MTGEWPPHQPGVTRGWKAGVLLRWRPIPDTKSEIILHNEDPDLKSRRLEVVNV